jgi:hypothetical protein
MSAVLKVLGCFLAFAAFILFVAWMGRPKDTVTPIAPATAEPGPTGAAADTGTGGGYRLATDEATITHELTTGDSIRFGMFYTQGGTLLTDSGHFFKSDDDDAVNAIRSAGERPAGASDGAVFVSPGGLAGAAAATVSLVDKPPPAKAFDRFTDVDIPAPSGKLLLAPNGKQTVSDAIELPKGDYRARIRVRGPENGEDVRIDLWPTTG